MFDQLVMAGGGGRCTWQLGFLSTVAPELDINPRVISAVSAGSLMSCILAAHDYLDALDYFRAVFAANRKNAYWGNLFTSEPVFPQYGIYRRAIGDLFGDRMSRFGTGPDIRIGITLPPKWMGAHLGLAFGTLAYQFDKHVRRAVHPSAALKLGFQQQFRRVGECCSVDDLADLILQSSCSPPLTPLLKLGGRAVLDGGVVDNVPVAGLDPRPGRVLVLLTRRYPERPLSFEVAEAGQSRLYVQPSMKAPIKSWDYTRPDLLQETFELGRRDGLEFLRRRPDR